MSTLAPLRLSRLRLERIRGFRELDVSLTGGRATSSRAVTLVIGKNGTNKSTLLRAICIGLSDREDASALLAQPVGSLVTEDQVGVIELELTRGNHERPIRMRKEIGSSWDKNMVLAAEGPSAEKLGLFVAGYGAGRAKAGSDLGRSYRVFDGVLSLFDYGTELVHPELTLRRLQDFFGTDAYEATMSGFRRVLDLTDEDRIEPGRGGGIEISGPSVGDPVRLEGWADGYRLTFTWLLDFYGKAMKTSSFDADGHVTGILLIDELEQHLHPSLQARVLPQLTKLLPSMQIVATTHSPLVALGVEPEELVVLRRHRGEIRVAERIPDYRGYSAEDMLSDERLFDSDVYAPSTQEQLRLYDRLVRKPPRSRTPREQAELRRLAAEMAAQPPPPAIDERVAEAVEEIERRLATRSARQE